MSLQRDLLEALRPLLNKELCRTCECLQSGLVQIELDGSKDMKALVTLYKVSHGEMHPCLGCDPCLPAEALSKYIRSFSVCR